MTADQAATIRAFEAIAETLKQFSNPVRLRVLRALIDIYDQPEEPAEKPRRRK